jgi:gliding motility-associated-like protein
MKLAALGLLLSFCCFTRLCAQDFSNKGKDFWVAYTGHIDGTTSRMALYITSDQNATGQVTVNGNTIPFTVVANQVATVQLTASSTPNNAVAYNAQTEGIGAKKGLHITADQPVAVYAHILNAARSGSTLVLPTTVLGKEYYVASYKSSLATSGSNNRRSQFGVIATQDNTTIQVTPVAADAAGIHPANIPFTITLSKGDVYQYQSENDLTGTHIKSIGTASGNCQPIAVFAGSTFTAMGCTNTSGDNLYQQLFPFASWGKTYYTAPFISRSFDIFRILVQDPLEPVLVNGAALPLSSLMNGRFYEINTQGDNTPRIITSDKPICVFQYLVTQGCAGSANSDPEMVALNPIEQTLNNITVMSARNNLTPPNTNIANHYLNIIFKTATLGSLQIDGAPPTATPLPIAGTAYSYLQQDVTASTITNPAHRITSDSGFICIAYGYGNVESYGYNAGTNVKDLYQFIGIQNQYATVSFPATCRTTPFYFSMTFPYQPTSIAWQFNGLFPNETVTTPIADSSALVNGRTLYWYKLPKPYTVANAGTYPIKVIAQNPTPDGCNSEQEITYDLQVFERPVADFTIATNGCLTDSVYFTNASNTGGRPATAWLWNFGDGGTAATSNAVHRYAIPNTYMVKYSVVTDIGCLSDTIAKPVTLTPAPLAKFGYSALHCVSNAIVFTDSSSAVGSTLAKWYWDFGDGSAPVVATNSNPQSHSYALPKTYTVTLKVENATGCQSLVYSQTIVVHPLPVPAFTFGQGCLPQAAIQFSNGSTISDGTQGSFSYAWRFGDGGTATVANPVHTYTSSGPFNTILTVTSAAGCIDSLTKAVNTIRPQPIASFVTSAAEVCLGASVQFTDNSSVIGGAITQWLWIFGDGTTATGQNPVKTFAVADTFQVKLVVYSADGCLSDTVRNTVIVNPLPTALFTVSNPLCETKDIIFTDASTANAGNLSTWSWDLGDGSTMTSSGPFTHAYNIAAMYDVSLQVTTTKGCVSAPFRLPVVVHPQPKPGFSMPGNCLTDPFTQFTDTSSIADGTGNQFLYSWDFGDANATAANPNTSALQHPQHKYTAVGPYNVTLTVTSGNGCTASRTQVFIINGTTPQSLFNFTSGNAVCSNEAVILQNNSSLDFGALVKLEVFWDNAVDPSNKTTILNPLPGGLLSHLYPEFFTPATKTYQVRVVAYSGINCFHESQQTVTVKATPQLSFGNINPVCADVPAFPITQASVLNGIGGSAVFSGPGVSSSGIFTPAAATIGTDTLRYTFTGSNACKNTIGQAVTVFPVPQASAGPDLVLLAGGTGKLLGTASGNGLSYSWSPATWLSSATILQPVIIPEEDKNYTLTVTSADGCTAMDAALVKVLKAPRVPNAFTPNGDGVNDNWVIQHLDSYPAATVDIYNRYGQQVFRSKGYPKPWDGMYGGKPVPVGTYYYLINPRNGRQPISGFVDVIR